MHILGEGDKQEVDWSSPQPTVGLRLKNGDKLRTKYVVAVGERVLTKADPTHAT
jgi:hypothetical protein